jgi:predicted AAA+ superfamily ATPase
MSKASELLRAGLGNNAQSKESSRKELFREPESVDQESDVAQDLEAILTGNRPYTNKIVKRTFEMRESHVEILDKVVKKARGNGRRITQSDALQFIINNWNEKFGGNYLD